MHLKKILFCIVIYCFSANTIKAQYQGYDAKGELGINVGAATYFGDINPATNFKNKSLSFGLFYQKYFNNYVGVKLSGNYAQLKAADGDNKNDAYQKRNLDFTNNVLELALSGSFNLFNYAPGFSGHSFTPYVSLGVGAIYTNPFTTDNGKKVFLRPLGTEGQNSTLPHQGKKYSKLAFVFPLSVGVKQAISQKINVFAEAGYRFTNTDYLDDVSSTYAGQDAFDAANYKGTASQAALAKQLQDRSLLQNRGIKGWQRGNSLAKDSYLMIQIGISYNFSNCNCPKVF